MAPSRVAGITSDADRSATPARNARSRIARDTQAGPAAHFHRINVRPLPARYGADPPGHWNFQFRSCHALRSRELPTYKTVSHSS